MHDTGDTQLMASHMLSSAEVHIHTVYDCVVLLQVQAGSLKRPSSAARGQIYGL